jgi:hypothetical protein
VPVSKRDCSAVTSGTNFLLLRPFQASAPDALGCVPVPSPVNCTPLKPHTAWSSDLAPTSRLPVTQCGLRRVVSLPSPHFLNVPTSSIFGEHSSTHPARCKPLADLSICCSHHGPHVRFIRFATRGSLRGIDSVRSNCSLIEEDMAVFPVLCPALQERCGR